MDYNSSRKLKLLKIWEILRYKTNSEHPITTQELIGELENFGICCERRTLYKDIDLLCRNGYDIVKRRSAHENTYYIEKNELSIPEIKIIMDAVQSVSFIPQDKTNELIAKLAGLSDCFCEGLLKKNTTQFYTVKHNNSNVYRNIDVIEIALEKRCFVTFSYFHLNEHNERVYSDKVYHEQAVGTTFEDGNYYLLCYRAEEKYVNKIKVFRIDRIDNIKITGEKICREAIDILYDCKSYKIQSFKMFGGNIQDVTLQFTPRLVEVVYDKFGYDLKIYRSGEFLYTDIKVQISSTFWGWLLQFPVEMKIYKPEELHEEYIKWVKSALK